MRFWVPRLLMCHKKIAPPLRGKKDDKTVIELGKFPKQLIYEGLGKQNKIKG